MADSKLSALAALTGANVADGDLFYVDDISVTTSKSITAAELRIAIGLSRATFTATLTGCTTSPTVTAAYSLTNNVVTLFVPGVTGTSNTTACTITGAPAAIFPTTGHPAFCIAAQDNSTGLVAARVDVGTDGVLTLYSNMLGAAWTASGTKGPTSFTITYNLA